MCSPLQRGTGSKAPRDECSEKEWAHTMSDLVRVKWGETRQWPLDLSMAKGSIRPLQEWLQWVDGGRRNMTEDKLRDVEGEVRTEQVFQEVRLRRKGECSREFPGVQWLGLSTSLPRPGFVWSGNGRSCELCSVTERKETKKHVLSLMILFLKKGVEFLSSSAVRTVELSLPRAWVWSSWPDK